MELEEGWKTEFQLPTAILTAFLRLGEAGRRLDRRAVWIEVPVQCVWAGYDDLGQPLPARPGVVGGPGIR